MNAARLPTAPGGQPPAEGEHVTILLNISERLAVIETQTSTIIEEQDEAKASRRLMHAKQDAVTSDLATMKAELAQIAPKVAAHERLFLQIKGGTIVLVAIWSIAVAAVGFVLREVWTFVAHHASWK